jgi:hypothetical protein
MGPNSLRGSRAVRVVVRDHPRVQFGGDLFVNKSGSIRYTNASGAELPGFSEY